MDEIKAKYSNLKSAKERNYHEELHWTFENIKDGFLYFYEIYQRYPTAYEIDKFEYLPSSRQIQRKFGGLQKIRQALGHTEVHFGKGANRTKISFAIGKRGRELEIGLEAILRKKFGDVFVHSERQFSNYKNRVDFYIYAPGGNFGVDIFDTYKKRRLPENFKIVNLIYFLETIKYLEAYPDPIGGFKKTVSPFIEILSYMYLTSR